MSVEIKLLWGHETELLTEAFGWSERAPKWFQESQDRETLQEFLTTVNSKLLYGIFDGELTALIRLNPVLGTQVFSIDLFAKRKTDRNVLLQAGTSLKEYLFTQGVRGFFGWIPARNKGIITLYYALGFEHTGMKCYKGQVKGRPVEWLYMRGVQVG